MKVDLNKRLHQDNPKAEIYHRFKISLINPRFEILCEYKKDNCRFDVLFYDKKSLDVFAIVEVRRVDTKRKLNLDGKQTTKYSQYGRVFHISQFSEIDSLLDNISNYYNECIMTA